MTGFAKLALIAVVALSNSFASTFTFDFSVGCTPSSSLGGPTCSYPSSPMGPQVLAYIGTQYNMSGTYSVQAGVRLFTRPASDQTFGGVVQHFDAVTGIKVDDESGGYRSFEFFDLSSFNPNLTSISLTTAIDNVIAPKTYPLGYTRFASSIGSLTSFNPVYTSDRTQIPSCYSASLVCSSTIDILGHYLIVDGGGPGTGLLIVGATATESIPEPRLTAGVASVLAIVCFLSARQRKKTQQLPIAFS